MRITHYISTSILAVFFTLTMLSLPAIVTAQSAGSECTLPNFQISSDDQVYALTGESFSYYVVTANNTSYQLGSSLPAGLSFTGDQIAGTPQVAGEYVLDFTASNDCGTTMQTVNITVVSSASAVAQGSASQTANIGLNEIPETGFEADSMLTISFYVLALLLVAGWFTRRTFTPATVFDSDSGEGDNNDVEGSFSAVMRGSFIPKRSIIYQTVDSTRSRQSTENKTASTQSTTSRSSDDIRRP